MLIFFSKSSLNAQDYHEYYMYIDSAEYFIRENNFQKTNECYRKSFNSNRGFPDDYSNAIIYDYFEKKVLDYKLIEKAFNDGLNYKDLKSSLDGNKIIYSRNK